MSRAYTVGGATITAINVGDMQADFADWLVAPEADKPLLQSLFPKPAVIALQCFHVAVPGGSFLVDAAVYDLTPDNPDAVPGYQPPPGLVPALEQAGIRPEAVAHVIFTHGHADHYNGAAREAGGEWAPCFPNARHYLHRADWGSLQASLAAPASVESRTLGALSRLGLLELVEGDRDLGSGVRLIHAPGETPGHQIVRIHSNGETAYCIGDLYHHPVEVERGWLVNWAEPESKRRSRQALRESALSENALLLATHIPGAGRLRQAETGVVWDPV